MYASSTYGACTPTWIRLALDCLMQPATDYMIAIPESDVLRLDHAHRIAVLLTNSYDAWEAEL